MDMYNTLEVSKCSATIISSFFHVADIKNTTPYLLPETARSGFKSVFNEDAISIQHWFWGLDYHSFSIIHAALLYTITIYPLAKQKEKHIGRYLTVLRCVLSILHNHSSQYNPNPKIP